MTGNPNNADDRLRELLAGSELDDLSVEEREELDALLQPGTEPVPPAVMGDLLMLLDGADVPDEVTEAMPPALRERLAAHGKTMLSGSEPSMTPGAPPPPTDVAGLVGRPSPVPLALAAMLALAGAGVAIWALGSWNKATRESRELSAEVEQRRVDATRLASELEAARTRAQQNEQLLTEARQRLTTLRDNHGTAIAEIESRNLELAEQLASATADLNSARLAIAAYEQPRDPAELAENRRTMLATPGTIRVAWAAFDVDGLPETEQRGDVTGDVVWNDELQSGYMRFVGLDANDPNIEQYQVWVIDERGLEQKVSGGVFDVTADGEVIVPIQPGIDVGRVALFAITVEKPGGTWVPDLERRVVVAPRGDG